MGELFCITLSAAEVQISIYILLLRININFRNPARVMLQIMIKKIMLAESGVVSYSIFVSLTKR